MQEILWPAYQKLREAGIKDRDLPSERAMVWYLMNCVDWQRFDDWVSEYARRINETGR